MLVPASTMLRAAALRQRILKVDCTERIDGIQNRNLTVLEQRNVSVQAVVVDRGEHDETTEALLMTFSISARKKLPKPEFFALPSR
ncbi:MAG: hypothetical protein ACLTBF_08115 [Christensenellales bacterium]